MGTLAGDLRNMGYERTEQESPFEDDAALWSDGTELVCDETGFVIRGNESTVEESDDWSDRRYFRYPNSDRVRMPGGFFGSYDWGYDDDTFYY